MILADVALGLAVPAVLAFTPFGQAVLGIVDPLPEALGAFLLGFLIVHISALVRLPLSDLARLAARAMSSPACSGEEPAVLEDLVIDLSRCGTSRAVRQGIAAIVGSKSSREPAV